MMAERPLEVPRYARRPTWILTEIMRENRLPKRGRGRQSGAHILLDDAEIEIWSICNDEAFSGEKKMQAILRIDPRYAGKSSTFWAGLLSVKDATIRQYETWKLIQASRRKAD